MVNSKSLSALVMHIMLASFLFQVREMDGGYGILVLFPNGYGADIVCHRRSIGGGDGLWEVAVVTPKGYSGGFEIVYDTPVTNDVIGYLDEDEVIDILEDIKKLPPRSGT